MFEGISVGAVGAAFIAAIVSLVGLIISKEQKISDFRQSWVDELRKEISQYLANINAISDKLSIGFDSQENKVKELSDLYIRLNTSSFLITLRLNQNEEKSKKLLDCMSRFKELYNDEKNIKPKFIRPIEAELLDSSRDLLKSEWDRVKKGEPTFVFAKWVALVVIVSMAVVGIVAAIAQIEWDLFFGAHASVVPTIRRPL